MSDSAAREMKIQFTTSNVQNDASWLREGKDALEVVGSELHEDGADVALYDAASGMPGEGARSIGIDTVVVGIAINLVSDMLFRLISEIVVRVRREALARRRAAQVEFRSGNVTVAVTSDVSADKLQSGANALAQALVQTGSLEIRKTDQRSHHDMHADAI